MSSARRQAPDLSGRFRARNFLRENGSPQSTASLVLPEVAEDILETEVRKDDVWLLGYPHVGMLISLVLVFKVGHTLNGT